MSEAGRVLKDKLQVYTTPEIRAQVAAAAAAEGKTIKELVTEAVLEKLSALGYDVESAAVKTTRATRAKTEKERGGNAEKAEKAKRAGKRKNTGNR